MDDTNIWRNAGIMEDFAVSYIYRMRETLASLKLWRFSLVDMKTRKLSPQESGSKVICSGHAHAIAAMHHN